MNKVLNCYTLEDLCNNIPVGHVAPADADLIVSILERGISDIITNFSLMMSLNGINKNDLYRMKQDEGHYVINPTPYSKLLNLIRLRYDDEYCVITEDEIDFEEIYNNKKAKEFCKKFTAILIYTKDKYVSILNIYDDNLSKLMDGLKTTTEASHEIHRDEDYDTDVSGKNLFNDTPQTTDVVATIEGNQYVNELSKSEAHTDNTGDVDESGSREEETTIDTKYTIEKIKEIQDSYEQVLKRWSDEFSPLFKEEA